jgi:adenosylcobyric acid synthase
VQALAAGVEPEVAMNPILLKPTGERTSQVVVMGRPVAHMDAAAYHDHKPQLLSVVLDALDGLRDRYDVVICEGAGNPAEINLIDRDVVNLRVAAEAGMRAIVVGDIDRGGVFASLFGTLALLPPRYRDLVGGFVINKLRGDPALLGDGPADLERLCGVPVIGVMPFIHDIGLDAEDSLALTGPRPVAERPSVADGLDVVAIRFPRLANFTDLDALAIEPGVGVRLVDTAAAMGQPDLVILPGSKATVADLEWLRGRGLDRALRHAGKAGATVLGICGGYQMLGREIIDHVESGRGRVQGLGWLDTSTTFEKEKITRQRRGRAFGQRVSGYEIHHGRVSGRDAKWIELDDVYGLEDEGAANSDERVLGTSLHGLMEEDGFRGEFLAAVAGRREKKFVPAGVSFAGARQAQLDRLADMVETHVDMAAIETLLSEAERP